MNPEDCLPSMRAQRATRVGSLRELPREAAPARDLWPAIADRLNRDGSADAAATGRQTGAGRPQRSWRRQPGMVAASIFAGLVAAATLGWFLSRGPNTAGLTQLARMTDASQYLKERPLLLRSLNGQLAALPPASQRKVLADLAVIERSMRDVQSALGRDPGNALLRALLVETYQDEEGLLLTVQEASVWTRQAGGQGKT